MTGVLAGLGILAVIIFEIYILYKLLGTHMGQKWRTMWLGQLLLFGIFLCYLTLFAYLPVSAMFARLSLDVITFLNFFFQLYGPSEVSSMGNLGCLPWGKPAATVALSNLSCTLGVLVFL